MRTVKALLIVTMATMGILTFAAAPASAATKSISIANGDTAYYNNVTNVLSVCDNSPGNGTARGLLKVAYGNTWEVYDNNGAQPGCGVAGPLSVDNSKEGWLIICPTSDGVNCTGTDSFPV